MASPNGMSRGIGFSTGFSDSNACCLSFTTVSQLFSIVNISVSGKILSAPSSFSFFEDPE